MSKESGMGLCLSIENVSRLPDGGPLSVRVSGKDGLEIGRAPQLGWTLPDPDRHISAKHCEIRYENGYVLYDVSTNGTFLNGSDQRLQGPHRLRHGDRLGIGHYIIAVEIDEDQATGHENAPAGRQPGYADLWNDVGSAAPPIAPNQLQAPKRPAASQADFLDWIVDVPNAAPAEPVADRPRPRLRDMPPGPEDDMSWAQSSPEPPPAEPVAALPTPRRPKPSAVPAADDWDAPLARSGPSGQAGPASPAPPPRPNRTHAAAPQPSSPREPLSDAEFLRRLAQGAGVPQEIFACQDPDRLAELLGSLLRLVLENLKQLLKARAESKSFIRSSQYTTIHATDNNPLKFSPTTEDALRLMFGPPTSGYLDAVQAVEESFRDIKIHQIKTYSAMQHALRRLAHDLDPGKIESMANDKGGIGAVMGSRKAKLWDAYVARWQAMAARHDDGLLDVFMAYFVECYDSVRENKRETE